MKTTKRSFFLLSLIAMLFVSCAENCNKSAKLQPAENKEEAVEIITQKQQLLDEPMPKNIAGLDYKELNEQQRNSINKLFEDEICPCSCPTTFAECIVDNTCPPAKLLAQWSIDQLNAGAPERSLLKAISEEINSGFAAPQKNIDVTTAWQKGNKSALVSIVEFADFECPACKIVSKELSEFYEVNKDSVQIYFMHFPLSTHLNAEFAAIASEAAGKMGHFWKMHDLLFAYNGTLSEDNIKQLALKVIPAAKINEFQNHLKNTSFLSKVKAQREYALNDLGVIATPTLFFNGRPYNLSWSKDGFKVRIEMEKLRAKSICKPANSDKK